MLFEDSNLELLGLNLKDRCSRQIHSVWEVYRNNTVGTPYTFRNVQDALIKLEFSEEIEVDRPRSKRMRNGKVTLGKNRMVRFVK